MTTINLEGMKRKIWILRAFFTNDFLIEFYAYEFFYTIKHFAQRI